MEDDEEQKTNNYAWEEQYKRSWDVLKEDENGSILKSVMALKKKKTNRIDMAVQRGIIRQLVIVIDCSRTMAELDLRPNRLDHTLTLLSSYFTEFLDQNPLSSILLLATKDGLAERLSDWLASPAALNKIVSVRYTPSGEPSLQNSLELARQALITVPNHVSREILVLYGALNTCDPDDLNQTIDKLKSDSIRVSIINLSAQMHICEMICKATGGTFTVVQNQGHYRDLLFNTIPPPPLITKSQMIQMGFPNTIQWELYGYPINLFIISIHILVQYYTLSTKLHKFLKEKVKEKLLYRKVKKARISTFVYSLWWIISALCCLFNSINAGAIGYDKVLGSNALVNITHGNYALLNILGLVNLFYLKDIVKCFNNREHQTEIDK